VLGSRGGLGLSVVVENLLSGSAGVLLFVLVARGHRGS
jgi:hypothetical protein